MQKSSTYTLKSYVLNNKKFTSLSKLVDQAWQFYHHTRFYNQGYLYFTLNTLPYPTKKKIKKNFNSVINEKVCELPKTENVKNCQIISLSKHLILSVQIISFFPMVLQTLNILLY